MVQESGRTAQIDIRLIKNSLIAKDLNELLTRISNATLGIVLDVFDNEIATEITSKVMELSAGGGMR